MNLRRGFNSLRNLISFVRNHPLAQKNKFNCFLRILKWQIACRFIKAPMIISWVNQTRFILKKGMTGVTGNYYVGLHEFADMGFVLHFLDDQSIFFDLGANVGSYTILAAGVCGARVISVEPIYETYKGLLDNIGINGIQDRVKAHNVGLGSKGDFLYFTQKLDAENHVSNFFHEIGDDVVRVAVTRLDELAATTHPCMIKLDVEGYETEVIKGGLNVVSDSRLQCILIELNGAGQRYGFDEKRIRDQLEELGFELCEYDPWSRDLKVIDLKSVNTNGNSLYIRNPAAVQLKLLNAPAFNLYGYRI